MFTFHFSLFTSSKKTLLFALCAAASLSALAQDQMRYTYFDDHKFWANEDLMGYTFVPSEVENPPTKPRPIRAGEVSFAIMRDYLYVREAGKKDDTRYSVNTINPESFGYKLLLVDARDPSIQGHLKIVIDGDKYVRAIIFKKSRAEKEVVYHLPEPAAKQSTADAAYFTDRNEVTISNKDDLWKKSVRPFYILSTKQNRLYTEDSLEVSFTQDTVVVKKAKIPTAKDSVLIAEGKKKAEKDKKKIVEMIHLRYREADEKDPTAPRKNVQLDFPIVGITTKVNNEDAPNADDMRYLMELKVEGMRGKDNVFRLFLTEKHTISIISIGEFTYFMRGL